MSAAQRSERAHLEFAARTYGSKTAIEALAGPEIPEALEYLYDWWLELDRVRKIDGMSGAPEPLTPERIKAWQELSGHTLDPLEFEAMMIIDLASRAPEAPEEK